MCGIIAYMDLADRPADLKQFKAMCSSIVHRGPDSAGYAIMNRRTLALGSVRLAINDIAGGDQPIHSQDKGLSLVCNGEIYDYKYWREHLASKGHRLTSFSDSELIIHMYKEYGMKFIEMLNGEFAFALWDDINQKLILARDRAGVKPLYYYSDPALFLAGSEAKALLAHQKVPRKLSQCYLTSSAIGVAKNNACAFEGINSLRSGCYIVVENGLVGQEIPYFNFDLSSKNSIPFEESVIKIRNAVEIAVNRRLQADVPVNCYLSGGLDSNIICGLMAQKNHKFTAYHASFANSIYDEYHEAKTIASHFGQNLEVVHCDAKMLLDYIHQTVYHVEMPLPNCNSIGKLLLSKLVNANGHKVCLTGEGADEIFGGYAYFKLEMLWYLYSDGKLNKREFKDLLDRFCLMEQRSLGLNWHPTDRWKNPHNPYGYQSYLYISSLETGSIVPHLFQEKLTKQHLPNAFLQTHPPAKMNTLDPFNATRSMALEILSGAIIPFLGDRIEMANSVECRTPFLDNDVIRIASELPPAHFINMETLREKYVLQTAFSDLIPQQLVKTHKHPFVSPRWRTILSAPQGRELIKYHLSNEQVKKQGIFKYNSVQMLYKIWANGAKNWNIVRRLDPLIGIFLTTSILHETFISTGIPSNKNFVMLDRSYN